MIFIVDIKHNGSEVSYAGVTITRKDTGEVTMLSNLGDPELDWRIVDLVTQYYVNQFGARMLAGNGVTSFTRDVAGWRWQTDAQQRSLLTRIRKSNGT
jgi:hypothetical protein